MRQLEIGPGKNRLTGFETLDIAAREGIDFVADAGYGLPFKNGTYDLIYASHVLEHIPWYKTEETLREWVRVLKQGGSLEIWVPDGHKIWQMFTEAIMGENDGIVKDAYRRFNPDGDPHLWLNGRIFAYGDDTGRTAAPESPFWHRAIFTFRYLEQLMTKVGLEGVRQLDHAEARGASGKRVHNLGIKGTRPIQQPACLSSSQATLMDKTHQAQQLLNSTPALQGGKTTRRYEEISRVMPPRIRQLLIASIRCVLLEGWVPFTRQVANFGLARRARYLVRDSDRHAGTHPTFRAGSGSPYRAGSLLRGSAQQDRRLHHTETSTSGEDVCRDEDPKART